MTARPRRAGESSQPVETQEMAKYSVSKQYDDLIGHFQTSAMSNLGGMLRGCAAKPSLDISSNVGRGALDGR